MAITESDNQEICDFIAINLNPNNLYNLMIELTKKIYCYHQFMANDSKQFRSHRVQEIEIGQEMQS